MLNMKPFDNLQQNWEALIFFCGFHPAPSDVRKNISRSVSMYDKFLTSSLKTVMKNFVRFTMAFVIFLEIIYLVRTQSFPKN